MHSFTKCNIKSWLERPYPTHTLLQKIDLPLLEQKNIALQVLRLDLMHPTISGNKWFKLKYNLKAALAQGQKRLLTFGGAYSNHLYACAHAARLLDLEMLALVRGEEQHPLNSTLAALEAQGCSIHYLDRSSYRQKQTPAFLENLRQEFGDFYLIPEGGCNAAGVEGCKEIIPENTNFDFLCTAVGTGTTLAGLAASLQAGQKALGFVVLKGAQYLEEEVAKYSPTEPIRFLHDYHFGGYAKHNALLDSFMEDFTAQSGIALEHVYTGKMFYGLWELLKQDFFPPQSRLLAIHSGGLRPST
jgi:1-aminocyclopropane-1-carboxylate deaminase